MATAFTGPMDLMNGGPNDVFKNNQSRLVAIRVYIYIVVKNVFEP